MFKQISKFNLFLLVFSCAIVLVGLFARIWNLNYPHEVIFDEVYFPVFANNYIHHTSFFDIHPPFGKYLIAIGILLFGDNQFGWRIIPAIFGVALLIISGLAWWRQRRDSSGALILTLLLSLDGIFIAYSRTGLMDGILVFFIAAAYLAAFSSRRTWHWILTGLLIGLACSIKWPAVGVIVPIGFVAWRNHQLKNLFLALMVALVVYLGMVFGGQVLLGVANPWQGILTWHEQAWHYQISLKDTHPWGSPWWTWPMYLRPVLLMYHETSGEIRLMTALPNPILGWLTSITVIGSTLYLLWRRLGENKSIIDHPTLPLILGWAALYLPWMLVHRVVFLYHFMPAYWFGLMLLTFWLSWLWKKSPLALVGVMVVVIASGFYFLPWSIGSPLSAAWLARHVWVKTWLY